MHFAYIVHSASLRRRNVDLRTLQAFLWTPESNTVVYSDPRSIAEGHGAKPKGRLDSRVRVSATNGKMASAIGKGQNRLHGSGVFMRQRWAARLPP